MKEHNYWDFADKVFRDPAFYTKDGDLLSHDMKLNWGNDDFSIVVDIIADHIPFTLDEDEEKYLQWEDKIINSLINNDFIINKWEDDDE